MKKVLFALSLLMFVGTVGVTAYAATTDTAVTHIKKEDDKKKKKKGKKDKKASCTKGEGASSCCAKKKDA